MADVLVITVVEHMVLVIADSERLLLDEGRICTGNRVVWRVLAIR